MFHLTTHHHSFTKKADIVVKIWSYNEHRVYTKNNRVRLIKQHGGFAHCWYDSCITWDELGLAWVASKLLFKKLLIQNKVDYFKQSEFLAPRVQNSLAIFLSYSLNFLIDHNASCSPPKFCITHCFTFLLGITGVPKWLCKILGGKQGVLWSMRKWWIQLKWGGIWLRIQIYSFSECLT